MPKDILPKVTFCPKTSCPIWQFAHEDILPKDFLPKLTICPNKTNCPREHFTHILEDFPRIFVLLIQILEGLLLIHFMIMQQKTSLICIQNQISTSCISQFVEWGVQGIFSGHSLIACFNVGFDL